MLKTSVAENKLKEKHAGGLGFVYKFTALAGGQELNERQSRLLKHVILSVFPPVQWQAKEWSPTNVCILIPGTCEYVCFQAEGTPQLCLSWGWWGGEMWVMGLGSMWSQGILTETGRRVRVRGDERQEAEIWVMGGRGHEPRKAGGLWKPEDGGDFPVRVSRGNKPC